MSQTSDPRIHHFLREIASDELQLTVQGDCMTPSLGNGERIEITGARFYWPGDILVYRDQYGRLLVHRLLGYYRRNGAWKYLIQADNARGADMGAVRSQIIGKVVSTKPRLNNRIAAIWRYLGHATRRFV